ncbi:MAG TPA: aldehyde dehydrogenase family protein, partial [bacterium]|nr:aldehyde dehydrogenase family protein [bacterium]
MIERRLSIPGFSGAGERIALRSPYSGEEIARVELAGDDALDAAMTAAHQCFQEKVARTPAWQRREWLERAAQIVVEEAEDLALQIAKEGG